MSSEEANTWIDKVEELGSNLFAGRELTHEESLQLFDYYLSGKYLIRNLEIVRKEKQKALDEVTHLEAAEQRILEKMQKQNICITSHKNNEVS
ncbi:hypothetical protein F7734_58215 [Scytonema sp. UIC 10036]|uniref:hypothetical protein n=1 Tax=Scytonema sp. UIC 10036 TaxID=2304196 RepID=UPI0012DA8921|nr:hypothetical protein [Scytonema sp. UIC 10036]MUH01493.1 hypothetical protein [Scytonema sp. UIC 10036]